jgi:hypothetical protein
MKFLIAFFLIFFALNIKAQQTIDKLNVKALKLPSESTSRAVLIDGSGQVKASSTVSDTELSYLDGLSASLTSLLSGKENTISLTANRAVQSSGAGVLEVSSVTSTELGYVSGVTSGIQSQLGAKLSTTGNESASGTKTFTGKLVTSTTSNGSIPCPVMTQGQRDAIVSPVEGDCIYNSSSDKTNVYTGSAWIVVGSGVGGINYITNSDIELDTTGFAVYADAAGVVPVDGTGGSPNVTISRSTTTPLRDTADFNFVKDAANRQGQGFSYDFTIASADKNQLLKIEFEYEIVSGTYASNDMGIFIYDVSNAVIINPLVSDLPGLSGTPGKFISQFQATSSTSYRLIAHVKTTSASAYTLAFDTFKVGLEQYFVGTIITDPVSWTPTGSMNTNTTYSGKWWRNGKFMEGYIKLDFTGAPNSTSLTVNLPSGYSIDTSSLLTAGASNSFTLGYGNFLDTSANDYAALSLEYSSTTALAVKVFRTASIANIVDTKQAFTQAIPVTVANTDVMNLYFKVPIQGWTSANAATQGFGVVPYGHYAGNAGESLTSLVTNIPFAAIVNDSTASFSGATLTIPEAGLYLINGSIRVTVATAGRINLYVGGTFQGVSSGDSTSATIKSFTFYYYFRKGDAVTLRLDDNKTLNNTSGDHYIQWSRIDKNMFGMNQQVFASYTTNAGQSNADGAYTIVNFEDRTDDTHNSVTTGGSWKFTAPVDGLYTVLSSIQFASASFAAGVSLQTGLFKNNVQVTQNRWRKDATQSFVTPAPTMNHTLKLNAGDFIDIRVYQDSGGSRSLSTTGIDNYITIIKEN